MLAPDWPWTQLVLALALAALIALFVVRTVRKDRREYRTFKRYRTTAPRQKMMRRWLVDSFLSFGGTSLVVLLLAWPSVGPLLAELAAWPVVRNIREWFADAPLLAWCVVVIVVIVAVVATAIGLRAARAEEDVPTIGDISAMLPRNRQELLLGGVISVNAGVVEELMFRLALPALVYGATGSAVIAVAGSILLFGILHLYQGAVGVIGTGLFGAIFMLLYAVSGTIAVPIMLHALFDLRSLVLIPVAVYGVHRVDGLVTRVVAPRPVRTAPAATNPAPPQPLGIPEAAVAGEAGTAADRTPPTTPLNTISRATDSATSNPSPSA